MNLKRYFLDLPLAACLLVASGCGQEQTAAPRQLPMIDVAYAQEQRIQSWFTYTTRLEASQRVSVMPRVSGVIESVQFIEGEKVRAGDVLFQLDARPFEARVEQLRARVAAAIAELELASSKQRRASDLRQREAISIEAADERAAFARQKQAELEAFQAQLKSAELELEFTAVRAPINGTISRVNITKGNNVIARQTVLTNIVSSDLLHAYFDIDERTLNAHFSDVEDWSKIAVVLQLAGEQHFDHAGHIDFLDNAINPGSGTLRVRALFESRTPALRAGAFARIRIAKAEGSPELLVPDRAIGTDLKNRFVLVLGEENRLQYRPVELGDRYGEFRVISQGLGRTEAIAVNGPARVAPGMTIVPNEVSLDLSNTQFTLAPRLESVSSSDDRS